jgi:hypothetical protein
MSGYVNKTQTEAVMKNRNWFKDPKSKDHPMKYDIYGLGRLIPRIVLFFFSKLTKDMGGELSCD